MNGTGAKNERENHSVTRVGKNIDLSNRIFSPPDGGRVNPSVTINPLANVSLYYVYIYHARAFRLTLLYRS